jgi:hypothetical protein
MNDGNATVSTLNGTLPYSYNWSNGGVAPLNDSLVVGWNLVTITDFHNCQILDSIHILPSTVINPNIGPDTAICSNSSYLLVALGYQSYLWSDGSIGNTISINSTLPGTTNYNVTVTTTSGCMLTDSAEIRVHQPVSVNIAGDSTLCAYDTTDLNADQGFINYLWNTLETTSSIHVTAANYSVGSHSFSVFVTDSNQCSGQGVFNFEVYPEVIVDLGVDTMILDTGTQGTSYLLDAGPGFSSYLWHDNANTPTYFVDGNNQGMISIIVTDTNGCNGYDTVIVLFVGSIAELDQGTIKAYPNPATDFIQLELADLPHQGKYEIIVYSLSGSIFYTEPFLFTGSRMNKTIDLSNFQSGTYLLKISAENWERAIPIVVN